MRIVRTLARRGLRVAVPMFLALATGATVPGLATASHPEVSLPGSAFEIDLDANIRVDDTGQTTPPSLDWANVPEVRRADSPSGGSDESFGNGTKEDTAVPSVVDGGIPPNKSDLKFFGVHQEGAGGSGFLNMYWSRVQDPSGTTNMDFEFNRRQCTPNAGDADCSGNGITPLRTAGDLLITYDLSNGGVNPTLSLRTWSGIAWSGPVSLTGSGRATGSINTSSITAAAAAELGGHDPRTFGEAQIDLRAIFGSTCQSFGSVYLKSRSSDTFTSALKDFVPPAAVNISNCGTLAVEKYIDNDESGTKNTGDNGSLVAGDLTGWKFSITGPGGYSCTTGVTDATGALTGCTLSALQPGTYTVTETTANSTKTIGTGGAFGSINTDPGQGLPASKPVTVTNGGNATVQFGNSCLATANFSVTGIPTGTGQMFARYTVTRGSTTLATSDVNLTGTGTSRTASVPGLRKGDSVAWSFGLNADAGNRVNGTTFTLGGYPTCSGSGSGQFQAATVTALKYRDINADGQRQSGSEPGQGGFEFQLKKADGTTVGSPVTSSSTGVITFTDVAPGNYKIAEVNRPAGWLQTEPASNGELSVSVVFGDTTKNAGAFGNTPLSKVDVNFTSLGKNPGTSQDATKASSISCTDGSSASLGSTTTANSLSATNLTLPKSTVTCTITYVDNP